MFISDPWNWTQSWVQKASLNWRSHRFYKIDLVIRILYRKNKQTKKKLRLKFTKKNKKRKGSLCHWELTQTTPRLPQRIRKAKLDGWEMTLIKPSGFPLSVLLDKTDTRRRGITDCDVPWDNSWQRQRYHTRGPYSPFTKTSDTNPFRPGEPRKICHEKRSSQSWKITKLKSEPTFFFQHEAFSLCVQHNVLVCICDCWARTINRWHAQVKHQFAFIRGGIKGIGQKESNCQITTAELCVCTTPRKQVSVHYWNCNIIYICAISHSSA